MPESHILIQSTTPLSSLIPCIARQHTKSNVPLFVMADSCKECVTGVQAWNDDGILIIAISPAAITADDDYDDDDDQTIPDDHDHDDSDDDDHASSSSPSAWLSSLQMMIMMMMMMMTMTIPDDHDHDDDDDDDDHDHDDHTSSSSASAPLPSLRCGGSEIEVSCLAAITTMTGSCQLESLCSGWKSTSSDENPPPQILSHRRDRHFSLQFGQLTTHLNHFSEQNIFNQNWLFKGATAKVLSGSLNIYQDDPNLKAFVRTWSGLISNILCGLEIALII